MARFFMRADVPKVQGGASSQKVMRLVSVAELGAGDGDQIAWLVSEAFARPVAILDRREHGAGEQHEAIGILVVLTERVWPTRSSMSRLISPIELVPSRTKPSSAPSTRRLIVVLRS